MDGELFTDSEQDWSSSSESDWMSETGKGKGKQGVKRKMNQQNGYKKKIERTKNSSLPGVDLMDIFQEIRKKDQLAVHCGKFAGRLYRIKYDNGEKCISCKGKWFTPSMFEKFGGKGHHKKWKSSIYYNPSNGFQQFKLLELIQNGCLSEFGQLRESNREGTSKRLFSKTLETPVCGIEEETIQLDSSSDESVSVGETAKTVTQTGSPKRLFSKTLEKPVCGIEEETIQLDSSSDESLPVAVRVKKNRRESTANAGYSFSDESITVAERVKMNRRESVIVAETFREKFTEPVESTAIAKEPAVSRQLRESIREVTPKESLKRFLSKSLEIPVCRIEEETFQLHRFSDESVSVAEKVKMAQNRREYVTLPETVSKKITELVKSTAKVRDSPAPPTDATEPGVSPVVEEGNQTTGEAAAAQLNFSDSPADATEPGVSPVVEEADLLLHQTTDEAAGEEAVAQLNFSDSPTDATEPGVSPVVEEANQTTDEAAAAQLNFNDSPADATEPEVSPVVEEADLLLHQTTDKATGEAAATFSDSTAEWQNPDAPKKTKKTEQMQLIQFLENQFNTMNNTLKSIDLSLKKLVEKQSQHTPPQYIYLIPADFENTQINSLIKKEPVKEGGGSTEEAEL